MRSKAEILLVSMPLFLVSCAALEGLSLGSVMSRVDIPRLLDCAKVLPDGAAAARCLGARALTNGLQIALDEALRLAEQAKDAGADGAGADDMSPHDEQRLAAELDASLDRLASEIAATYE
jgi:hypothetical protein